MVALSVDTSIQPAYTKLPHPRLTHVIPEVGNGKFLRKGHIHLHDCMVSQPTRTRYDQINDCENLEKETVCSSVRTLFNSSPVN